MNSERKPSPLIAASFVLGLLSLTAVNYIVNYRFHDLTLTAVNKSALRLLFGAGTLFAIGVLLGLKLRPTWGQLWRYAVVGPLNMAVPQALIFVASQLGVGALNVGIAEAAITGVIIIYMFTGKRPFSRHSLGAFGVVTIGFAIVAGASMSGAHADWNKWALLLAAALLTGVGLVVDDWLNWPKERTNLVHEPDRWRALISPSLRKTLFSAAISAILSFVFVAALSLMHRGNEVMAMPSTKTDWSVVVALAVFGTCLSWLCIFYLISKGKLALTATMVAAIPMLSILIDFCFPMLNTESHLNESGALYWLGTAITLAGLLTLIYNELIRPRSD